MRRILVVNILILLVFAGVFYWADEKKKVETAMAEKGLENIPARPAGSESVQEGEDTKSTEETKEEGGTESEPTEGEGKYELRGFAVPGSALQRAGRYAGNIYNRIREKGFPAGRRHGAVADHA